MTAPPLAPALKLHHPIPLSRRVTLRQWESARLRENPAKEDRFVVDFQSVPLGNVHERPWPI